MFRATRRGDGRAREAIVEAYLPLARKLARRYRPSSEPPEDVEQIACLALVKAVDGFDIDRGTAFSSYAVPCISGAIKRYFRDHAWAVRVPRELQELALRIQRLDDQLVTEAGRHPTAAELTEASGADRLALDAVLAQLDERDRLIVQLYYRDELTQAEIGRRLGYSQMHISRLIRAAVAEMQAITRERRVGAQRVA